MISLRMYAHILSPLRVEFFIDKQLPKTSVSIPGFSYKRNMWISLFKIYAEELHSIILLSNLWH